MLHSLNECNAVTENSTVQYKECQTYLTFEKKRIQVEKINQTLLTIKQKINQIENKLTTELTSLDSYLKYSENNRKTKQLKIEYEAKIVTNETKVTEAKKLLETQKSTCKTIKANIDSE